MADVTVVQFLRTVPPYLAGEEVGLPHGIATRYAEAGAAKILRAKVATVDPATLTAQRKAEDDLSARSRSSQDDGARRQGASNRAI